MSDEKESLWERVKNCFDGTEDDEAFERKVKISVAAIVGVLLVLVFVVVFSVARSFLG